MRDDNVNLSEMKPGDTFIVGNKWYGLCSCCMRLVRINKPFFGSLHLCMAREDLTEPEQ